MSEHPEVRLRNLLGYVGTVRASLRMQNWDIILHKEPLTEEDVWARTWQAENHSTINVKICEGLYDRDPQVVRNTIVHELVHAQHRDVSRLWESCTLHNTDVPAAQSRSWDGDFHIFMERFVSWTTLRIEQSVPLYQIGKRYRVPEGCYLLGENPN